MSNNNSLKKILITLFILALLFLLKQIKFEANNEVSYEEFLENISIDNVKKKLLIIDNKIFFEPKKTNVPLKSGYKKYDKLRYSVEIPKSELKKIKQKLSNEHFEFKEIEWIDLPIQKWPL